MSQHGKFGALQFVCGVIAVSVLLGNIFKYISIRLLEKFKANMVSNLRQAVFDNSINLHLGFYSNEHKGNLISRIVTDVQEVENSIANTFSAATKEVFLFIFYIASLFYISWNLTFFALLVIEPLTASTIIGNYMQSQGVNFFGFSNGVAPSTNQVDFENEINTYLNYSGWTSGELPDVQILTYPTVPYPTGNDTYGNQMTSYNFLTRRISASTISGPAWYTFFISSGYTNGLYQKSIDVGTQSQNIFTEINNNSVYYTIDFELIQNVYRAPYTRMYTTFPSPEFLLNNTQNIYFKGSVIGV
jgi:hypothetical protein